MEEKKDLHIKSGFDNVFDFEKRYCVIIEKDAGAKDGYDYLHPEEFKNNFTTNDYCTLTFYYKLNTKHNPSVIVESIEGDDFEDRKKIVNHFLKHFALKYSVECDGFYEGL